MGYKKTQDKTFAESRYKEALELYKKLKACGMRVPPPPRVTNVRDFGRPHYNLVDVRRYRRMLSECRKKGRGSKRKT